jgi:nucleoid-associated protein YgaU
MFKPDGTPVRARLTVTFSQYSNAELEAKEIKRETADYSKVHVVRQGETLATIAAVAYGDPRTWRPIALRNRIDNPRRLTIGAQLMLPQLPYRDPDSGKVYS